MAIASNITQAEVPKEKTKTLNAQQLERASFVLKNIAHHTRLAILLLLHQNERLSVSEICDKIKAEPPVTSHHLSNMKIIGILSASRDGKNVYYSLKENSVIDIISLLESIDVNLGVETNPYLERIDELAKLEDDWDGYGGYAPVPEAVENMRRLINYWQTNFKWVMNRSSAKNIYPFSHGTLAIAWHHNHRLILHVEVGISSLTCVVSHVEDQENDYYDFDSPDAQNLINQVPDNTWQKIFSRLNQL